MDFSKKIIEKSASPALYGSNDESDHAGAQINRIGAVERGSYKIIRRNGEVVSFDNEKIIVALSKAFLAEREKGTGGASSSIRSTVQDIAIHVQNALFRRKPLSGTFHIEEIQDQVELALMRSGHTDIARAYILYREDRAQKRRERAEEIMPQKKHMIHSSGEKRLLDIHYLENIIEEACDGLAETDSNILLRHALDDMFDGVSEREMYTALVLSSRALIEKEPEYSQASARLLLAMLRVEIIGFPVNRMQMKELYPEHLADMIKRGIAAGLLNPKLAEKFDLPLLGKSLKSERDQQFSYLGLQTLYDRYFMHIEGRRIEMPQTFFMRIAMGLALNEDNPTARAQEFYELLSSFRFMSSTPTLFNSGTTHSQLSSCYLTTVGDDLNDIFEAYKENALLAKFAGGLGNDWTPVRAMGSHIKGTNGLSQGVIPFLKIVNDTAVAVNQGGKRKGAVCSYLETWHLDLPEFLELRKNTGDERRRAHDMNTANWIPDLFMKRVIENKEWTLFSPSDAPQLHDLCGEPFEAAYTALEARAAGCEIEHKKMPAKELWRKMLTMLFETGHPWITYKDACNLRSPQQHVGVVHSSNLCTEITLNTNDSEIAVCNLGSVNLPAHLKDGEICDEALAKTIKTAMRMLDNVIDINYYAIDKAKKSNIRHRPVGLGIMGFQDCLYEMNIRYNSEEAVEFADTSMEAVCYHAYWMSTELAEERGAYESFNGSLWQRNIFPQDSLRLLAKSRGITTEDSGKLPMDSNDGDIDGEYLKVNMSQTRDWKALRERVKKYGMRNSNCVAIAPTATIANIVGVTASIEPTYQNIYTKSNLSGEFIVSNRHLVRDIKALGIWDNVMLEDIKYFDGRLDNITRIPKELREKYVTAFEIEPKWLIECAARRQKWIDQAQSLNLYVAEPSGSKLDKMYKLAWQRGLKTTYYLRSMGASSTEKYTSRAGALNAVAANGDSSTPQACVIEDPECEACQ